MLYLLTASSCIFCFGQAAAPVRIDLGGTWSFRSADGKYKGTGQVPGDVHTDLFKAKLIPDPYQNDNDVQLKWIGRSDWIYENDFALPANAQNKKSLILRFLGLDTVADVILNGNSIGASRNQFRQLSIDVISKVRPGTNNITVVFSAPVNYSLAQAAAFKSKFGHDVAPTCPGASQNGECQPNFIRWDWGPSFPTVGIWQPVWIDGFDNAVFKQFTAQVIRQNETFLVSVSAYVFTAPGTKSTDFTVTIGKTVQKFPAQPLNSDLDGISLIEKSISILVKDVDLWWPNGFGNQTLYDTFAELGFPDHTVRSKIIRLGFRNVELVQDLVNPDAPGQGRNFYFKVNDVPIFLKGTNWIPVSSFPAQNHTDRIDFLLDSAADVGMNAMRVWGGGRYEDERLYDKADVLGILIWHDIMFACATYPADDDFLNNVKVEVHEQIERLKWRPSILVWAGNNENEMMVAAGIFDLEMSPEDQRREYLMLYRDTVQPVATSLDSSRPFVMSSPSNGLESFEEGGISADPLDTKYGDIHYYNELENMWSDASFPITRCTTEYGLQSLAFKSTFMQQLSADDWAYMSNAMNHRQHHPEGDLLNLLLISEHFPEPKPASFTDEMVYYTQMHQAQAHTVETEHYRRWRGRLDTKTHEGNTMCALYWQLNDIWAAPTWASIDFGLRWKPAHYAARRFFTPVLVSGYRNASHQLQAFIVSDLADTIKGAKIQFDTFTWGQGFVSSSTENRAVDIPPQVSTEIATPTNWQESHNDDASHLFRVQIFESSGALLSENFIFANQLRNVDFKKFGDVSISDFKKIDAQNYNVTISATAPTLFVWIDVKLDFLGWFSDNAFHMAEPSKTVNLYLRSSLDLKQSDFVVCSLKDCAR